MEWSSGSKRKDPVKIVIIGTQFVETNPLSFKSVVQSYTGKDSCVSWVEETSYKKAPKRRRTAPQSSPASSDSAAAAAAAATAAPGPAPAPNLSRCRPSFKDWERLMLELPTPEEMRWMWSDLY